MRKRLLILGASGALLFAGGAVAAGADEHEADPEPSAGICIDLYLEVNGEAHVDESLCLPPEGGDAPGLPELPGLGR
jgi:hypothetical protein